MNFRSPEIEQTYGFHDKNKIKFICFPVNFVLLYICLYALALCWEILGIIPALMLGSAKIATVAYSSLFCLYSRPTKKTTVAYSAL